MDGLYDSYVTRKPLIYTLIVLTIILLLLIPIYFYTKSSAQRNAPAPDVLITETYSEVNYIFSPESELSEADKKKLFQIKYEGNLVQWTGQLVQCEDMGSSYRVSIAEQSMDFPEVLFTTSDDCTKIVPGTVMNYRIRLLEWKIRSFIGTDGKII